MSYACTSFPILMGIPAMSDSGESLPSPAPAAPEKRRGRPPAAGPETHRQRVERLQAELKEAQAAMKQDEEKRAVIVGHACLRHLARNTEFAKQLASVLRAEVKAKADRALIGDLLQEETPPL